MVVAGSFDPIRYLLANREDTAYRTKVERDLVAKFRLAKISKNQA